MPYLNCISLFYYFLKPRRYFTTFALNVLVKLKMQFYNLFSLGVVVIVKADISSVFVAAVIVK